MERDNAAAIQASSEPAASSAGSGRIITFYSYKGGTGRSMALANIAWILASNGRKVLAIDWDLEAPGLHRYFAPFLLEPELRQTEGLIEFVREFEDETLTPSPASVLSGLESMSEDNAMNPAAPTPIPPEKLERLADLRRYAVAVDYPFPKGGRLDFVPAGRQDDGYSSRVTGCRWDNLYERLGGAAFFEAVRRRLKGAYEYILIDSRTGISDTAGICTIQLPDKLVVCFTANNQSISGASAVSDSVCQQWAARPRTNEAPLRVFPVFTRVEFAEKDKLKIRKALARTEFNSFLKHIPETQREVYWGGVQVPYDPFYAYEELLAPFGDTPHEEGSVLAAMERLTAYLTDGDHLPPVTQLIPPTDKERRDVLVKYASNRKLPGELLPTAIGPTPRYDAYLSFNAFYKAQVLELATRLKSAGIRLWFSEWSIAPGDDWLQKMEEGMQRAAACIICIGANGLGKAQKDEVQALLRRKSADTGGTFRVIPVLLPGATSAAVPPELVSIRWLDLRESVTSGEPLDQLIQLLVGDAPRPVATDAECPYRGLEAFTEAQAANFFGREPEIAAALENLRQQVAQANRASSSSSSALAPLIAVTGPAGIGKSSFLRAGLLPTLRRGEVEGSARWGVVTCPIGADPLGNLAVALAALPEFSSSLSVSRELVDSMLKDKSGLQLALRLALGANQTDARRLLFVLDGLEELFTQCRDPDARRAFLENIRCAIREAPRETAWLLGVRSDVLADVIALDPEWERLQERNQFLLQSPSSEAMRDAIVKPAERGNFQVEPQLVERLLADCNAGLLNLSLLQLALQRLWTERQDNRLTLGAYLSLGGADALIGERAEELYQSLPADDQRLTQVFLLRCLQIEKDRVFPRDAVPISEFVTDQLSEESAERLARQLAAVELVQVSASGAKPVSVSLSVNRWHCWRRLEAWSRQSPGDVRIRQSLAKGAQAWERRLSREREGMTWASRVIESQRRFLEMIGAPGFQDGEGIIQPEAVAQAHAWAEEHPGWLNASELDYLANSRRFASVRKQWRWMAAIYSVILLVMTGVVAGQYMTRRNESVEMTELTDKVERLEQEKLDLDNKFNEKTNEHDQEQAKLSQQLLQAKGEAKDRLIELQKERSAASQSLNTVKAIRTWGRAQNLLTSAKGQEVSSPDRTLGLLLAREAALLVPPGSSTWDMEKLLREALGEAALTPLDAGRIVEQNAPVDRSVQPFALGSAGRLVATGQVGGPLRLWNLEEPQPAKQPQEIPLPDSAHGGFSDDAQILALTLAPGEDSLSALFSHSTVPQERRGIAWQISPKGATTTLRGAFLIPPTEPLPPTDRFLSTGNGRWLVTLHPAAVAADATEDAKDADEAPRKEAARQNPPRNSVRRAAGSAVQLTRWSPDRTPQHLALAAAPPPLRGKEPPAGSTVRENVLQLWKLPAKGSNQPPTSRLQEQRIVRVRLSPDERWLAAARADGAVLLFDFSGEEKLALRPLVLRRHEGVAAAIQFRSDSRFLVTAGDDRRVILWDLSSPNPSESWRTVAEHPAPVSILESSRDGRWLLAGSHAGHLQLVPFGTDGIESKTGGYQVQHPGGELSAAALEGGGAAPRLVSADDEGDLVIWNLSEIDSDSATLSPTRPAGAVRKVGISANGRWLIAARDRVHLIPLELPDLLDLVVRVTGRELTSQERAKYDLPPREQKDSQK
ncbi:MAG: KGGVGR-motif variant AAA ATPase [Planctomycetales bacterium]